MPVIDEVRHFYFFSDKAYLKAETETFDETQILVGRFCFSKVAFEKANETILNDAKSSFDLNESELAFARLSLEKSRRSLLKNHLTNAVGSFDFTQVLNFIEKMGKGEFKTDAAKWVGEVQAESMEIHKLYLEAVNTSDFVRLNAALNNVTFPPLKEMVEGLIEDLLAA